ncbi:MAG: hypothetical protein LBL59_09340, partial [Xanthomonadaceae bacterium]|nr:hypothetical protein [Xanthomonadaceae bacterium]
YGGWRKDDPVYPVVHMRIPKAPYFEPNASSGPYRMYNEYITMFYPNFSGLADEENAECRGIAGHCRRQMTVGFGFSSEGARDDIRAREVLKNDMEQRYIISRDEASAYPGLELVGGTPNNDPSNTLHEEVYLSHDEAGNPEYIIRCTKFAPSNECETQFRATRSPYIYVNLVFVRTLLPQWQSLIRDTRDKIDSMIVQTYGLPNPAFEKGE